MISYYTFPVTVKYSPQHKDGGSGYVLLTAPQDVAYYYNRVIRWLSFRHTFTLPLHKSHITVVSGKHNNPDTPHWGYRDGEVHELSYDPTILDNGYGYYFIRVHADSLISDIRLKLGLSALPKYPPHLTVAYDQNFNIPLEKNVDS